MVFAHSLNKLHLRGHWINRCNLWSSCKSGGRILHFIIATNVHRTIIREILLRIQTTEGDKRQTELTPTLELMAPVIVTHLGRGKWRLCRQERGEIFGTFRVIRRKCVRFVIKIAIFVTVLNQCVIIVNTDGNLFGNWELRNSFTNEREDWQACKINSHLKNHHSDLWKEVTLL